MTIVALMQKVDDALTPFHAIEITTLSSPSSSSSSAAASAASKRPSVAPAGSVSAATASAAAPAVSSPTSSSSAPTSSSSSSSSSASSSSAAGGSGAGAGSGAGGQEKKKPDLPAAGDDEAAVTAAAAAAAPAAPAPLVYVRTEHPTEPCISVTVTKDKKGGGNKLHTSIRGLEQFGIWNVAEVAREMARAFACGIETHELPPPPKGKKKPIVALSEAVMQGDHSAQALRYLVDEFGVPQAAVAVKRML